jgi:hypothetical protein
MSVTNSQEATGSVNIDPTIPAPMTNVAQYGFEGRFEDWADDARYFEYSQAANPIGSGFTPQVPVSRFGTELYQDEPTGVVPLDASKQLGIKTGEATSPALLANFVRIRAGEQIDTAVIATSQLYYVLYGRGFAAVNGQLIKWEKGDFLTLPAASRAVFYADAGAAMYWVHDAPLLRYLGADANEPKFRPTKFRRADAVAKLEEIAARPGVNEKSRVSVLLANAAEEQTLTITLCCGRCSECCRRIRSRCRIGTSRWRWTSSWMPSPAATPCWAAVSSAAKSSIRSEWTGSRAEPSSHHRECGMPTSTNRVRPHTLSRSKTLVCKPTCAASISASPTAATSWLVDHAWTDTTTCARRRRRAGASER